ncbi:phosphinothricin acetyltransferase [Enterococcus sp. AZ103]
MIKIRTATIKDATQLLEIYRPYVLNTNITFEYTVPTIADFTQRISGTLQQFPYLVAVEEEKIVGYAYAHSYKERAAYDWAVEVTVYVSVKDQAKGTGKMLYDALENELKKQNILVLTACITGGNDNSVTFHEKFGYQKVAEFKKIGYKFNQWHDVIWMQKFLQEPKNQVEAVIPYSEL